MARGFFSGVIAGTLVSGLGLGAASVLVPMPRDDAPDAAAVDVPAGSEFAKPRADEEATLPETQASPESAAVPEVSAPTPDDLSSMDGIATDPAARPETGSVADGLSAPRGGDGTAGVAVDSEIPVLPSPQAVPPAEPAGEGALSISTDPAQPAPPVGEEDSAFDAGAPATAADTARDESAEPEAGEQTDAESDPQTDAESAPRDTAAQSTTPEPDVPAAAAVDDSTGAGAAASSSIIGNLAPEVTTDRLPSVGDDPQEADDGAGAETGAKSAAEAGEAGEAGEDTRTPLERFAAPFENPEGKPLMSIILLVDGSSPLGLEALASFPYPISFAIDATLPDAADKAAIYRAAGFEVLAMVNLPEGASATDAEVAMQATFAAVPEAVAVMEGTGSGLQSSRSAAEQLAPILLDSGHGAVFFPKGLNTAQQLLARAGVPAVPVFRDFDANGQNATVIRRFLDQAAFKAGQEDAGVVMLGRLRPDTVSALLLWGLQDRASRVTLAPISAMLRGE